MLIIIHSSIYTISTPFISLPIPSLPLSLSILTNFQPLSIVTLPFTYPSQSGRLYPDTDSSGRTKDLSAPLIFGENQIYEMIHAFIFYYDRSDLKYLSVESNFSSFLLMRCVILAYTSTFSLFFCFSSSFFSFPPSFNSIIPFVFPPSNSYVFVYNIVYTKHFRPLIFFFIFHII
jgi:hypothetical protein